MKHASPEDPEFYTEMDKSSQHFVDRFCHVLWNHGPHVEEYDFRRSSMFIMPFIKFRQTATDGDMMRRLLKEFPYLTYEPPKGDKDGYGYTDPKLPWEISDHKYGDEESGYQKRRQPFVKLWYRINLPTKLIIMRNRIRYFGRKIEWPEDEEEEK
jgi:hypothetical protein